ncbi:hypothetical protein ACFQ58_01730 [Agromyces sp. NPDC056523]|uniref:hypothetical protein n=1 Tax=Agromyces sp. NPDC056523 TaxID=3345850 RepID=UPI00366F8934
MTRMPLHAPFVNRHARAGVSFLAVAVILAATCVSVGLAIPGIASAGWRSTVQVGSDVLGFAAVWIALPLGAYLLVTSGSPRPSRRALAVGVAVALPILAEWSGAADSPFLIMLALAAAVGGYALIGLGLSEQRRQRSRSDAMDAPFAVVTPREAVTGTLVLAHATSFLLWWVGVGFDLAGTLGLGGGDASPLGALLALLGAACLSTAILMQLRSAGPDLPAQSDWDEQDSEAAEAALPEPSTTMTP